MMTAFSSSDDDAFRNLTSRGVIASVNSLVNLRPSVLNLTSNCLATLDLSNRNASSDRIAPDEQVAMGAAFLQLVPSNFSSASVFDAIAYLQALGQVSTTPQVISDALDSCRIADRLNLPLAELNLMANCPSTSDYWWRFIAPSEPSKLQDSDTLNLILPALSPAAQTYSNATILTAVAALVNTSAIRTAINQAADACTTDSCFALSYQGDSDIGGLGALITYASVAFFTTVVCFACGHYYRKDDGLVLMSSPGRRATIKSGLTFADMVTYFSIMTALASDIYIYMANSLYEFSLAALVGCMAFSSVCLLAVVDLLPMDPDDLRVRTLTRLLALVMAQNVAVPTISRLSNVESNLKNWLDMPCYGNDVWPVTWVMLGAGLTIAAWVPYTMLTIFLGHRKRLEAKKRSVPSWLCKDSGIVRSLLWTLFFLSLITLWYCVAAIIYLRQRASRAFGSSFDNNFGYGQIIASGFVLQVIMQFAILRACRSHFRYAPATDTNISQGHTCRKRAILPSSPSLALLNAARLP